MPILERYRFDSEVALGRDCLSEELGSWVARVGGAGLLAFGRGQSFPPENQQRLVDEIRAQDVPVHVVAGLHSDMSFEQLQAVCASAEVREAKWVAAVGGGGVIDAGKLLASRYRDNSAIYECSSFVALQNAAASLERVPLLAAPTIIGSGAEVSPLSDVVIDSRGVRVPIVSASLFPALAVIDTATSAPPPHIQAAAIVDTVAHLLDPWLNSLPGPTIRDDLVIGLVRSVIRITRGWRSNALNQRSLWQLATISHLAVRPGLGRPAAPVSAIHRIEHVLSPRIGCRHGEGLAYLLPAFLRWMERMRPVVLAAVTGHFVEMFEFSARPSVVVERWLSSLPLEGCCPPIGDSSALEIADIVVESFGEAEMLPGSLSIKRAEIVDVLSEIHQRTRYAAPLAQRELTPVCNVDRVFGGPIPSGRCTVVFTPIRSEFELLCRSAAVKERQGWFSTAIIRGEDERRVVLACASPGGSTADDCLTFLLGAVENVEFVLFIGLAGSVSPVFNVGDVVWPSFVEVQPECARAARIQTVPFAPAFGDMANTRGCVVGSIRCLGDESRDLLELWRWKDVNLIDLEISTVASWCDARQVPFSAVFVVSDRPLDDDPLWKRQPISADGLISKALQKVAETVISSVINRQVAHDAQGEQS